jgi:6-hydroxycyclohex-1-ene-1-carbonyl-CoA dehydrogenase
MAVTTGAYGFRLAAHRQPLEQHELPTLEPGPDEVVVQVAGCGVCHTDVGFAFDGVPTRHPLPLVLGHEIAGRVVAAGERASAWLGKNVLVPAVIPCGACAACRAGRATICSQQFMPGNDGDGGFATHTRVPARGLCPIPDKLPAGLTLEMLSVVADAVTTPFEAIRRAEVSADDVTVFVGVGGVGGFGVQIAAARGAAVVAIDTDSERLELAAGHGASLTLDAQAASKNSSRRFALSPGRVDARMSA